MNQPSMRSESYAAAGLPQGLDATTIRAIIRVIADWSYASSILTAPLPEEMATGRIINEGRTFNWPLLEHALHGRPYRDAIVAAAKRASGQYYIPEGLGLVGTPPLDKEQIPSVMFAVQEYVRILDSFGHPIPMFFVDIEKSALIQRLLSGKPPLAAPPPLSFSYPWYEIVESSEPQRCALTTITVNDATWDVVGQQPDGSLLVRWQGRGPLCRVWQESDVTARDPYLPWMIERLQTPD